MGSTVETKERSLVVRAQGGDREAFSVLVRLYLPRVYRAARSIMHNHDDASDVAQETFVRAFRSIERFDASRPLFPWLYQIARNLCLNRIERVGKREVSLPEFDGLVSHHDSPEDEVMADEERARVRKAVSKLPEPYRLIVELAHFQECSYQEMADILGIPIGTVMSRLYHARRKLKPLLLD